MRYGDHQARSADALTWLLTHDEPVARQELSAVLSCRMALLAAHRERCELAIRGADVRRVVFRDTKAGRDFGALAKSGTAALAQLLDEYPTFADRADRFTDVLQRPNLSPPGTAWVQAAKHAVLATEALTTNTTWKSQPAQAWLVTADIAEAAQAIAALDRRFADHPEVSGAGRRSVLAAPADELALAARHVGYVARSGVLDLEVDRVQRHELRNGVTPVRTADDLVLATAGLERLVRHTPMSVGGLRRFALMQAEIAHLCGQALGESAPVSLRDSFARHDHRFRAVAGATARVSSIGRSRDGLVLAQTQEIGRGVVAARRAAKRVPVRLLADFDGAQRQVAKALAANVREALYDGRYLVVDQETVELKWRRLLPGEEPSILQAASVEDRQAAASGVPEDLDFAAMQLGAAHAHPTQAPRVTIRSSARERLQSALTMRPTGLRPPAPGSPAVRHL